MRRTTYYKACWWPLCQIPFCVVSSSALDLETCSGRTDLTTFDSHIGNAEGRPSPKLNASVSVAIARRSHRNLDVLKLSGLSYAPVQRSERIAYLVSAYSNKVRVRSGQNIHLRGCSSCRESSSSNRRRRTALPRSLRDPDLCSFSR
jgi:hypothetical protein